MTTIRLARPGDGLDAETLARVALGEDIAIPVEPGMFAAAIDQHGGLQPLPHGSGCALVTCAADDTPIGLAYTCPPIQLIEAYADRGTAGQRHLTHALAELEMLAVAKHARGAGVGTALLSAIEERLRTDGVRLLFAKVAVGDPRVLRWYERRGYFVATYREPVVIDIAAQRVIFDDGGDGYRLVIKPLDPAEQVDRVSISSGTYLMIQPARPPVPRRPSSASSRGRTRR